MATTKILGYVTFLSLSLILIASCTSTTLTPTEEGPPTVVSPLVSPLTSPIHVPPPPTSTLVMGPSFTLDQPLRAGSTVVTGQGPPGVPIVVVDITRMGRELGSGTIGPDGRFSIEVSPLPEGDRVGIMLGEVTGTDVDPDNFLRGEGYFDIPMVGILFDAAMVEP